ncbi:hypothetical protein KW791_03500 [Candidatus Parcubacteria bacterium]|nr:hypothetical protein [Candidatus Parcubacteria bacterium]
MSTGDYTMPELENGNKRYRESWSKYRQRVQESHENLQKPYGRLIFFIGFIFGHNSKIRNLFSKNLWKK